MNTTIEFPCPYDGENTNIHICEECPYHLNECDTYITMLNESFDS